MNWLTFLVVLAPLVGFIGLFLLWDGPLFQNRTVRRTLSVLLLVPVLFCAFGALASYELPGAEGLAWRLRYLALGGSTLLGSLYLFFKRPLLAPRRASLSAGLDGGR